MTPHPPLAIRPDPHPLTPDCVRGLAQFIAARKNAARQITEAATRRDQRKDEE